MIPLNMRRNSAYAYLAATILAASSSFCRLSSFWIRYISALQGLTFGFWYVSLWTVLKSIAPSLSMGLFSGRNGLVGSHFLGVKVVFVVLTPSNFVWGGIYGRFS